MARAKAKKDVADSGSVADAKALESERLIAVAVGEIKTAKNHSFRVLTITRNLTKIHSLGSDLFAGDMRSQVTEQLSAALGTSSAAIAALQRAADAYAEAEK